MATVVNNPASSDTSSGGMGFLLGVILIIVFAILFFVYALPLLQRGFSGTQAPQVTVPGQVNVDVNQK
jgi:hypothetical protein